MLSGILVTLRAVSPEDYPALNRWANDVEVEVLGGGEPPLPRPMSATAALHERLAEGDSVNFAIEADGAVIGTCGLFNADHVARTAEFGIGIGERAYWGRGYGREATALVTGYGFRHLNLHKVWLTVHAGNERAIRAYAAAGFVEEGRQREQVWSDGRYDDLVYMGLRRPVG